MGFFCGLKTLGELHVSLFTTDIDRYAKSSGKKMYIEPSENALYRGMVSAMPPALFFCSTGRVSVCWSRFCGFTQG